MAIPERPTVRGSADWTRSRAPAGGRRGRVVLGLALAGLVAGLALGLDPRDLVPSEGGLTVAHELFARALSPAWTTEDPQSARSLLPIAVDAAWVTVRLAVTATSLALVLGGLLGLVGSSAVWQVGREGGGEKPGRLRWLTGGLVVGARLLAAGMRSVHELLWAVLLLAALGVSPLAAVVSIAIPYAGTLAKVFAEMLDEAPRDAAVALRAVGASPVQVFALGLLPRALPDLAAYALYRFECALRSAAVLGFFGFPTLGYYLAASFENLHYGEVWTYLYTLVLLVLAVDAWSGSIRRRLVA